MKRFLSLFFSFLPLLLITAGCSEKIEPPVLTKCLNIGNALDAPKDQPWDVPMDISYFSLIKQAGFQCVRLPVRFSDYVDTSTPAYTLEEAFMLQIDAYVQEAQSQNLTLILDFHHFTEIMEDPAGYQDRLIAIWEQLAARYKNYPDTLVFELLNEPQQNLYADTWNGILADTVKAIRAIDGKRFLIVGGADFNSVDALDTLQLPNDKRLIVTIHYYEPTDVAFQGVPYQPIYENLHDIVWAGTAQDLSYLKTRLEKAKAWADQHHVPLFLGEFGVSQAAPVQTRRQWTAAVVKQARALGISYGYWEFASHFGVYDLATKTWDTDMVNLLVNPEE